MNKAKQFTNDYSVSDSHAARILGVARSTFSDWKSGKRAVPPYIERSIDVLISLPQCRKKQLTERWK